jgi:ribokinase
MPSPSIVVVGSSNTDLVIRAERLPCPGETVLGGEFQVIAGGKGANQAVAAARAGARVTFLANIGADDFGNSSLRRFRKERIDTRFIVRSRTAPSGVALILVGSQGENLISVARSSNDGLEPADVDAAAAAIRSARCLVAQLEIPLRTVRRAIEIAHDADVPVLLNPAPAQVLPKALLRKVTWLTPNEGELAQLTGRPATTENEIASAAQCLHEAGVRHVLVTCGPRGVCWSRRSGVDWLPAMKVKAVDTVGAGDCFSGAMAAALAEGEPEAKALLFAITAAGISVTRAGAQPSMPARGEILANLPVPSPKRPTRS